MMGAAGFEPATTWSEAKHSIQTELSARTVCYLVGRFKSRDSEASGGPLSTATGFMTASDQKEYYRYWVSFS